MNEKSGKEHFDNALMLSLKAYGGQEGLDEQILFHATESIRAGISPREEAHAHLMRKDVFLRLNKFDEAEAEMTKALRLDEKLVNKLTYSAAYHDLAEINRAKGNIPGAVEVLKNGIAGLQRLYDPSEIEGAIATLYCDLGAMHLSSSADDHAFENLQRALGANPNYPDTYMYLGVLHGSQDSAKFYDVQKARQYYEQFLALTDENDPKRAVVAKYISGLASGGVAQKGKTFTGSWGCAIVLTLLTVSSLLVMASDFQSGFIGLVIFGGILAAYWYSRYK